jgi:hypothetical protein
MVLAGTTRSLTNERGDVVLEISRGHVVPRRIDGWIRVQGGVRHEGVEEVADDDGNRRKAAEPVVQGGLVCGVLREGCLGARHPQCDDRQGGPCFRDTCGHD